MRQDLSHLPRMAGEKLASRPRKRERKREIDLPRLVLAGVGAAFAALLVSATPDLIRYVRMARM